MGRDKQRWLAVLSAWSMCLAGCVRAIDLDALPKAGSNGHASGGSTSTAGKGGASGSGGVKGSAGASGTGGRASTGGRSGTSGTGTGGRARGTGGTGTVSYPPLDMNAIGKPTQITVNVTPALSLAESPVWDPCQHRLLFPDVQASVIYALKDGKVSTVATNTNNANGMAYDIDGTLVLAQMGPNPGHLARLDKSGKITVIDPPGSPALHTPDDVVVRSDGTIYFTDAEFPPVGGINFSPLPIYSLAPGGKMFVNQAMSVAPNGIELSPDEKTLYLDVTFSGTVMKFDVAADGALSNGMQLATGVTGADSLCLDAAGNLYVGVSTGLQIVKPDGTKLGIIPIQSSSGVTNCTFGDDDGKTLYITAWTTMWKVTGMPIPGLDWVVDQQRVDCSAQ